MMGKLPIYLLVAAECIFCAHSLAEQHSTENKSYYKYIENNCGHFDYTKISKHPRILMLEEDKKDILENLKNNPRIARIHESILKCADSILDLPPNKRIQTGRRLLSVSQDVLSRVFFLSYAYRMTFDEKYLYRAKDEMEAAANFSDWNPPHFLDTAEMTMALAIGYDWLGDKLPKTSREKVKNAIVEKGLVPSLKKENSGAFKTTTNWNSVCNAGIVFGALAVFDDNPKMAVEIIERAIACAPLVMEPAYYPDGAYPEGYMYWNYGTTFQVLLCAALESAFGSDAGISKAPGFLNSINFIQYMSRPSGISFNFADCTEALYSSATLFWMAKKLNDFSALKTQMRFYDEKKEFATEKLSVWENRNPQKLLYKNYSRVLPCYVIFGHDIDFSKIRAPQKKLWIGRGENPVALVRTNWNIGEGLYLGIKGGKGNLSHAHLDAGSFVFDSGNIAWAVDLGAENYHSMESQGISLWKYENGSSRWKILRYHNMAHNTLSVDGNEHIYDAFAPISKTFDSEEKRGAEVILTDVLGRKVKSAIRQAYLENNKIAVIKDSIESAEKKILLRWNMCTPAAVKLLPELNTIELKKDGESLKVVVESNLNLRLKTWSAQPKTKYETPNSGKIFVGFECEVPPHTKLNTTVKLIPLQ